MLSSIKRTLKNYLAFRKIKNAEGYSQVTVVDKDDRLVGYMNLYDAIKSGQLRRVVQIYVFNTEGKLLLQKRSTQVLEPDVWDVSAGGHVDEGKSYKEAAVAELAEELGLRGVSLTEVALAEPSSQFQSGIYKVVVPKDIPIHKNNELAETAWFIVEAMEEDMKKNPNAYSTALREYWPRLRDKILAA